MIRFCQSLHPYTILHPSRRSSLCGDEVSAMAPSKVTQDAIFIGVNRFGDVCDYHQGISAFGAGKSVALWFPTQSSEGVSSTLNQHAKDVTAVKFIPSTRQIISGSEDGSLCLWGPSATQSSEYVLGSTLEQDEGSVTAIAVSEDGIVVSGSSSGIVYIWQVCGSELKQLQALSVQKNFLPTCLALQKIEESYILAIGGTSSNVFVYSFTSESIIIDAPALCATLPGHEDWIKCFAFVCERTGLDYILASGSQDRYIRLWRLRLNEAIDSSDEDELKLQLLSNKQYKFSIAESAAAFSFEALIMGHDDWVTGLKWHPSAASNPSSSSRKLQLLSLSADTALMIWEMDPDSGVWVSISRLGELSIKGASTATGSSGGFWSCNWFIDPETSEQCILASGKTGAIRMYRSSDPENRVWDAVLGVTGPIRDVTDVMWSADGSFFYATSLDQTTRLFAPWSKNKPQIDAKSTWHEFARPQIHGYDMVCLDNLSSTRFVSAGEEKILRVFEMTQSIHKLLDHFCDIGNDSGATASLPEAASLPVLGLSNKAANDQLEAGEAQQREEDFENDGSNEQPEKFDPLAGLTTPPLEDHLQRFSLFPEVDKLYGHGYEITCCACTPNGTLIATACRSNSAKHAVIRIFNAAKNYLLVDTVLEGHSLTITSMEFSPDGQYLLAVSRDRQFSLWRVRDEGEGLFDLVEFNQKAHTRIIWDASWLPQSTNQFVTGSRDKSIKLWEVCDNQAILKGTLKTSAPITSVSVYSHLLENGCGVLAVGNEEGQISLYTVNSLCEEPISLTCEVDSALLPATRVSKLAFSRKIVDDKLLLAVGSTDSSVRVFSICL